MRRYGDFSIAFFIWEANVENHSSYVIAPECFIKILSPDESLNITLSLQNEDDCMADSLFRSHILICNLEDMESEDMFYGFKSYMDYHHLLYPYSSFTLSWGLFTHWLDKKNLISLKNTQGSDKIRVFDESRKDNCMINQDGSYNSYLFIDTLHLENEGVILSRHDGHYYLFSDSSEIRNVKNYKKIIKESNVYIYEPDFIGYIFLFFHSEYFHNLILRMPDPGGKIYPETDYKTKHYFK